VPTNKNINKTESDRIYPTVWVLLAWFFEVKMKRKRIALH